MFYKSGDLLFLNKDQNISTYTNSIDGKIGDIFIYLHYDNQKYVQVIYDIKSGFYCPFGNMNLNNWFDK